MAVETFEPLLTDGREPGCLTPEQLGTLRPASAARTDKAAYTSSETSRIWIVLLMPHHLHAPAHVAMQLCMTHYSHSIVPGGLEVMSRVTRLISRTSLVMRVEIFSSRS